MFGGVTSWFNTTVPRTGSATAAAAAAAAAVAMTLL